jgi:hypothetical protein
MQQIPVRQCLHIIYLCLPSVKPDSQIIPIPTKPDTSYRRPHFKCVRRVNIQGLPDLLVVYHGPIGLIGVQLRRVGDIVDSRRLWLCSWRNQSWRNGGSQSFGGCVCVANVEFSHSRSGTGTTSKDTSPERKSGTETERGMNTRRSSTRYKFRLARNANAVV